MADTPNLPPPLDSREQPILEKLLRIRDELTLLKSDRASYVKSSDVMPLYERMVDEVKLLNEIRTEHPKQNTQVDRVLDGCFQLLSLFFMTIGRNNEAPAAYALTSTIKRLLDHLTEVDLYSSKDLDHISHTLNRLRGVMKTSEGTYSPKLITLLSNRLDVCEASLANLQSRLGGLTGDMPELHEKLISILRSISLANTRSKFSSTEVKKLQDQLKEIEALKVDGNFVNANGEVPAGNEETCDLLWKCLLWSELVLERKGEFPEAFQTQYKVLVDIRNKLEKLSLTQAWSLRETDLYDYQRQLDRIDESRIEQQDFLASEVHITGRFNRGGQTRVEKNFKDAEGNFAELYVQRTLLYLIRRSYAYIYFLMVSSEPVSEALLPVYNQLQTLRRCLIEVKNSGGVSSPRELYPYSMKLNSIDNMRVDGKFVIGDDIPEGQGSVNDLLADCFELSYELRVAAETEGEE